MRRRHFIGVTAASVLFAPVPKFRFGELAGPRHEHDYVFFDERFPKARLAAAAAFVSNRLIGVHGDVTSFWANGLDGMTRDRALRMGGVTTQSFLFCLRILADEYADLDVQEQCIDRNLLRWTLLTTPYLTTEPRHG